MSTPTLHDHPAPFRLDPFGADAPGEAARLRELGDVVVVELPGGIRAWTPTRSHLMESLATDERVSRDPRLHWDAWKNGWLAEHPEAHWMYTLVGDTMFSTYGVEAARLRKLVAPAFTGRRTKALRPVVERITADLLDRMAELPPGATTDLRAAFAHPLPLRLICEMYDVVGDEATAVRNYAEKALTETGSPQEAVAAFEAAKEAFSRLLARKRAQPGDDLTSALLQAQDGDDALTESEMVGTLLLVVAAGHETTVHLLGNAVVALLQNPDQLALVRAGKVGWESVVAEALRFASPSSMSPLRFAVEDITVGGTTIRAGEAILATFGHYGWDPEQHGEDAGRFDVTRENPGRHVAFGHGLHRCLGAPLAELEGAVALPALFERFPDLALVEEQQLAQVPSFLMHGYREIRVTLTKP